MNVEVRLFATLREGRAKRRTMELHDATTLGELVKQLEIAEDDIALPLVNGRFSEFAVELADKDVVSLFPPVGGG